MAKASEVLQMLCSGIEYISYGQNYEDIDWLEKSAAITKAQFEAGFAQYDAWKVDQDAKAETDKAAATAKLAALGLTTDDLKALGLGTN
jgi:hypothetical protein